MTYYTSSFMVHYTNLIVNSSCLNPENEGQSTLSVCVGKPVRFVARLVALIAIGTFFAPLGALYNGIKALIEYPEGQVALSQKHAFAAWNDLAFAYETVGSLSLFYMHLVSIPICALAILYLPPSLLNSGSRIKHVATFLPEDQLKYVADRESKFG